MSRKETFRVFGLTVLIFLAVIFGIYTLIKYPILVFVGIGALFIIAPIAVAVPTIISENKKAKKLRAEFLAQFEDPKES